MMHNQSMFHGSGDYYFWGVHMFLWIPRANALTVVEHKVAFPFGPRL